MTCQIKRIQTDSLDFRADYTLYSENYRKGLTIMYTSLAIAMVIAAAVGMLI